MNAHSSLPEYETFLEIFEEAFDDHNFHSRQQIADILGWTTPDVTRNLTELLRRAVCHQRIVLLKCGGPFEGFWRAGRYWGKDVVRWDKVSEVSKISFGYLTDFGLFVYDEKLSELTAPAEEGSLWYVTPTAYQSHLELLAAATTHARNSKVTKIVSKSDDE